LSEGVKKMEVKKSGSQPSQKGPEEYFTGSVRVDPLSQAPEPARVSCVLVTFEPGARSAWHWHPLGQTLVVTQGCGWAEGRDTRRGRRLVPSQREALARRDSDDRGVAHRHPGGARRQGGRVDGEGQR
jgi:hypothetical protein